MNDPMTMMAAASAGVVGLGISSAAGLKAWNGWLEVRRLELSRGGGDRTLASSSSGRYEVADLRERVRRLEAIASGTDV